MDNKEDTVGATINVTWLNPDFDLPSMPLNLLANDSQGAATMRRVSIILCGCANNGSCMMSTSNISTLEVNQNGHYQWPCECSIFFGGDACEVDLRGCGDFNPCPDYSVCVNDSTVESGYVCDQCNTGFEVSGIGDKCSGMSHT